MDQTLYPRRKPSQEDYAAAAQMLKERYGADETLTADAPLVTKRHEKPAPVCLHPSLQVIDPVNGIAWCPDCFASLRAGLPEGGPEQTEKEKERVALAQRGQRIDLKNGDSVLITRIDVQETPTGVVSHKFADGWYDNKPGTDLGLKASDYTLDQAVSWMEEHGYRVRRWSAIGNQPAGARGFLGDLRPVRRRKQIIMLRDRLMSELQKGDSGYGALHTLDFAYDC